MPKVRVKLADIVSVPTPVSINEKEEIFVRALTLKEMVTLFIESRDLFLPLYAAGIDAVSAEALAPFLLASPELVAKIIALASDEPDQVDACQRLPVTVQLDALFEVWKASVPDAKKARELLSEVTALLQKLRKQIDLEAQKTFSPSTLPAPSSS